MEETSRRRTRRRLAVTALAASAALPACADSGAPGSTGWTASVDTIADTVVVRTASGSVWGDTMRLVPEVEIGVLDGPPELIFGRIGALDVDARGRIWVVDQHVPEIRVFEPDGSYAMTVGRPGAGPGELNGPDGGFAILSDGRALVRDPANARIQVYGPDGEPLDTWQVRGNFNTSQPLWKDREDNVYTQVLLDPDVDLADWKFGLVRYAPDGTAGDTLVIPESDWEADFVEGRNESSISRSRLPFSPREAWLFHPDGYFAYGISSDYAFTLLRGATDPDAMAVRIERDWEPVAVEAGEAAEERARITHNMRSNFPGWKWNGPAIPDTKAPYSELFAGRDGRLWVQVGTPGRKVEDPLYDPSDPNSIPDTWDQPVAFDVFEPDGRFLGHVRTPAGFSASPTPRFEGNYVWAVARDELDVQRVVRYRLEPAPSEGADH